MIGVAMRNQDCIEPLQTITQRLLAKVGRSVDQNDWPACSMRMETRKRLSRGSSEVQVSHSQAMEGTPVDVPVPRNVSFMTSPMSNVQSPKSNHERSTYGLWTLDIGLWTDCYPPGYVLAGKAAGLWRGVGQRNELHSQIGE